MKKTNKQLQEEIAELKKQNESNQLLINQMQSDNDNLKRIGNNYREQLKQRNNEYLKLTKDIYIKMIGIKSQIYLTNNLQTHKEKYNSLCIISNYIDSYIANLNIDISINDLPF